MISKPSFVGIALSAVGIGFVFLAIVVASPTYARILTADGKDLSWGPTLFRSLLAFHGILLLTIVLRGLRSASSVENIEASGVSATRARITSKVLVTMATLSVVGLGLRLWNLNSDLWIDEVFTLLDFVRQPAGQIVTSFPNQNQHMLFSLLAHYSTSVFGESAWSVRLPSVIFGIGSIWALFFLARRLFGIREALLGSALITVSYHHIWFSQNARGYMGLLLFTLLATWCWIEALGKNGWGWWMGYAATIILGMWVHPTMAFVVAAHGMIHLLLLGFPNIAGEARGLPSPERRAGIKPFVAWLLSVTVTLQLYALSLPEFLRVGLNEESKPSEWTNPLWTVTESILALRIGFGGIVVVIFAGAFVLFGWVMLFRSNRRAAFAMVLPSLLTAVTMLLLGHNIWPRFFFFSMGFGLLIVIHGAMQLPVVATAFVRSFRENKAFAPAMGTVFALLIIAASLVTVPKNYALPKQDFSGAKEYLNSQRSPGDRIVAVSLAGVVYGRYMDPPWPVAKTASELETIQAGPEKEWLVYTLPIEIKAFSPDLWGVIERDYDVVRVFPGTLNGGEVYICMKKDAK